MRTEPCDPASLERQVRQLLADKISGNQVGIWLLAPEHLRLGTWDLLCAWSQCSGQTLWPRMALHLVHEAAPVQLLGEPAHGVQPAMPAPTGPTQ